MTEKISGTVIGLYVGAAENRWADKPPSAIGKSSVTGPLEVDFDGFVKDQQADKNVHGGPEKAIHHYAAEHMSYWNDQYPDQSQKFVPGCFGENISSKGLFEENLCLGDVLTLGNVTVQICQGRQPCWKLNAHMGLDTMAAKFQKTGRTGWYYRVLECGKISVGDRIELVERTHEEWPLARVIKERFNPRIEPAIATTLSEFQVLSENWREAFAKKSSRDYVESTDRRLLGRS